MQFDYAMQSEDPQRRGYLLGDLLARTFGLHGVEVARSFRRNEGGEQIDGAFRCVGWRYIVECRWRAEPADMRQLDGLVGQLGVLAIKPWTYFSPPTVGPAMLGPY
jgi:hypothetical protein